MMLGKILEKLYPGVVPEYRFAPPRRWRFDFAWPSKQVALEIEGGVFTGGRHTRGQGFVRDLEKYNTATVMGWSVIRATPSMVKDGSIHGLLKQAL